MHQSERRTLLMKPEEEEEEEEEDKTNMEEAATYYSRSSRSLKRFFSLQDGNRKKIKRLPTSAGRRQSTGREILWSFHKTTHLNIQFVPPSVSVRPNTFSQEKVTIFKSLRQKNNLWRARYCPPEAARLQTLRPHTAQHKHQGVIKSLLLWLDSLLIDCFNIDWMFQISSVSGCERLWGEQTQQLIYGRHGDQQVVFSQL